MTNTRKNVFTIFALIVLLGLVVLYIYKDLHKKVELPPDNSANQEISASLISSDQAGGGQGTIEQVKGEVAKVNSEFPKQPNLNVPIVNRTNLDKSVFDVVVKNIGTVVENIKKDPKDESSWINLAIYRKMLGDYQVSLDILNYIAVVWPTDYVVRNNLADLHQHYIKNYRLAEENWLKVIELKPDYPQAYEDLYDLYSDGAFVGKQGLALPILLKGLDNNPESTDLMIYIARHYKNIGDKESATKYYTMAISRAVTVKNVQLEQSFRTELSDLNK